MNLEKTVFFENFPAQPRKGDLRRLEIVRAAIHLIARDGYDNTILANVAKHLGTRRPHIVYYFKTRDELLMSSLQFVTAVAQKITIDHVTKASTPIDKVVAISEAAFEWAGDYPDQAKFMLLYYYQCTFEKRYWKLHAKIRETGFQRMRALLSAILPAKSDLSELDEFAKALQVLFTGFLIEHMTTGMTDIQRVRDLSGATSRRWIHLLTKT